MKKSSFLLLLGLLACLCISAQDYCGFDRHQKMLDERFPLHKEARLALEAKLLRTDIGSLLRNSGATTRNSVYTGVTYEIPVVVHVIEPSSTSAFANYTVTDQQIRAWIDSTNAMYATTHNKFFDEGTGIYDGTVIPIRLVMAKRDPLCRPTTGIVRVSGASIPGYDQYGVKGESNNGAEDAEVRALSPHWDEASYFNIYLVTTFDGSTSNAGLMGWCSYPSSPNAYYDSFMKIKVVQNGNGTTLAHEFGHAMGLIHPFENEDTDMCPVENNCEEDNDKVCDTEVTKSLLGYSVLPIDMVAAQGNNECTGEPFRGVQYNVMNYTNRPQKFTPGQRDRALAVFLSTRGSLVNSLGATEVGDADNPDQAILAPVCSPQATNNPDASLYMGPVSVKLANIDNPSSYYALNMNSTQFYIDYAKQICLKPTLGTILQVGQSYELIVDGYSIEVNGSIYGVSQYLTVWIDYNNNGVFEDAEVVGSATPGQYRLIANVTPPNNAVKNTYLRMRVRGDNALLGPCDNLSSGQVEDYAVKIVDDQEASIDTSLDINSQYVVYAKEENKFVMINNQSANFGNYVVYNLAGGVVKSGQSSTNEIYLDAWPSAGAYIIEYHSKGLKISKKVMVY